MDQCSFIISSITTQALTKKHCEPNFLIFPALEIGTAGKADGFVGPTGSGIYNTPSFGNVLPCGCDSDNQHGPDGDIPRPAERRQHALILDFID